MNKAYKIYGIELSPYSVKVRSYFRYKSIPHEWVSCTRDNKVEYERYSKLPLIPVVVTPEGEGIQDSTPIIELLESKYTTPSIYPDDTALRFISALIEEFGDEWGNKLMFHHRWHYKQDQDNAAYLIARITAPYAGREEVERLTEKVLERMVGRGYFVGSDSQTAPLIESYFEILIGLLETHLQSRNYLFGNRPSFGDFGLFAQFYEMSIDPTCGGIMRARTPNLLNWCFRMLQPYNAGAFESWEELQPTLAPLLDYIGTYFLPWSQANADALLAGEETFSVELAGKPYSQSVQKYHAKSLNAVCGKYLANSDKSKLNVILDRAGCLKFFENNEEVRGQSKM